MELFNVFAHLQRRWLSRHATVVATREQRRRCLFESMEARRLFHAAPLDLNALQPPANPVVSQNEPLAFVWQGDDANNLSNRSGGSIEGIVHFDLIHNSAVDPEEGGIAGVPLQLLDPHGQVLATTVSDAEGHYRFDGLAAGTYAVRQLQPAGLFQGGQQWGSAGGEQATDLLFNIPLSAGQHLSGYNFGELPPSILSGYVFRDGPTLLTPDGLPPLELHVIRDGLLTPDDVGIAGVTLELRNSLTGEPIRGQDVLPGSYPLGPIRTVTDSRGFYQFHGLPAGSYAVVQVQPIGYVDSTDTPGVTGGVAINPQSNVNPLVLQPLTMANVDVNDDAILRIPLGYGEESTNNNFSEVQVESQPAVPPYTPDPFHTPRPTLITPPFVYAAARIEVLPLNQLLRIESYAPYAGGGDFSWHLSVMNHGSPHNKVRGEESSPMQSAKFLDAIRGQAEQLRQGMWNLPSASEELRSRWSSAEPEFGLLNATPLTGDFNGDGISELVLYRDGEWFIDLNGNGRWDENDLVARLGTQADRPVVGDWDGDGKDDIGIFGPQWARDHLDMRQETGLPDAENYTPSTTVAHSNPSPDASHAPASSDNAQPPGPLGKHGWNSIDHVFQLGAPSDVPISGDFNGDGIDSIGTYRGGLWRLDVNGDGKLTTHDRSVKFGEKDDIPIVGDFDGDGIDEIGIYRDGQWIIDSNHNGAIDAADKVFELGGAGEMPIVGDFNGDGIDEPGTYRSR